MDGPQACGCGAPGDPCPLCDKPCEDELPKLPEGFTVDYDRDKGWRH